MALIYAVIVLSVWISISDIVEQNDLIISYYAVVIKQDSHQDHKAKDLRSKGLCLVPVSCTQNVGGDINIGADYWAPAYGSGF